MGINFDCIKSFSISKTSNDNITIHISGLKDDINVALGEIIHIKNRTFYVTNKNNLDKTITSVTLSTKHSVLERPIDSDYMFTVVPQAFIDISQFSLVNRVVPSSLSTPLQNVYIMGVDDIYGETTGYSASYILNTILNPYGIFVNVASGLDYGVVEFRARTGTPVLSLIKSLFPFPFITIFVRGITNHRQYIYVQIPRRSPVMGMNICRSEDSTYKLTKYEYIVRGMNSRPMNIINSLKRTNTVSKGDTKVVYYTNLLGNMFGITYKETTQKSSIDYNKNMYIEFTEKTAKEVSSEESPEAEVEPEITDSEGRNVEE